MKIHKVLNISASLIYLCIKTSKISQKITEFILNMIEKCYFLYHFSLTVSNNKRLYRVHLGHDFSFSNKFHSSDKGPFWKSADTSLRKFPDNFTRIIIPDTNRFSNKLYTIIYTLYNIHYNALFWPAFFGQLVYESI